MIEDEKVDLYLKYSIFIGLIFLILGIIILWGN